MRGRITASRQHSHRPETQRKTVLSVYGALWDLLGFAGWINVSDDLSIVQPNLRYFAPYPCRTRNSFVGWVEGLGTASWQCFHRPETQRKTVLSVYGALWDLLGFAGWINVSDDLSIVQPNLQYFAPYPCRTRNSFVGWVEGLGTASWQCFHRPETQRQAVLSVYGALRGLLGFAGWINVSDDLSIAQPNLRYFAPYPCRTRNRQGLLCHGSGTVNRPTRGPKTTSSSGMARPCSMKSAASGRVRSSPLWRPSMPNA